MQTAAGHNLSLSLSHMQVILKLAPPCHQTSNCVFHHHSATAQSVNEFYMQTHMEQIQLHKLWKKRTGWVPTGGTPNSLLIAISLERETVVEVHKRQNSLEPRHCANLARTSHPQHNYRPHYHWTG